MRIFLFGGIPLASDSEEDWDARWGRGCVCDSWATTLTSSSRREEGLPPPEVKCEMVWACALIEGKKSVLVAVGENNEVGEARLSELVASLKIGCLEGLRAVPSADVGRFRRREMMFSWASVRGRFEGML